MQLDEAIVQLAALWAANKHWYIRANNDSNDSEAALHVYRHAAEENRLISSIDLPKEAEEMQEHIERYNYNIGLMESLISEGRVPVDVKENI